MNLYNADTSKKVKDGITTVLTRRQGILGYTTQASQLLRLLGYQ